MHTRHHIVPSWSLARVCGSSTRCGWPGDGWPAPSRPGVYPRIPCIPRIPYIHSCSSITIEWVVYDPAFPSSLRRHFACLRLCLSSLPFCRFRSVSRCRGSWPCSCAVCSFVCFLFVPPYPSFSFRSLALVRFVFVSVHVHAVSFHSVPFRFVSFRG